MTFLQVKQKSTQTFDGFQTSSLSPDLGNKNRHRHKLFVWGITIQNVPQKQAIFPTQTLELITLFRKETPAFLCVGLGSSLLLSLVYQQLSFTAVVEALLPIHNEVVRVYAATAMCTLVEV